jgi:tetrahydromethanopterin S-methyltransferase subunit C
MSHGPSGGPAGAAVDSHYLLLLGIIGGLLGIYLIHVPYIGPVFAALGAVCAIIWGSDAIRRVASYGLGTGVPSIGYMTLAIGVVGALGGIALFTNESLSSYAILGPIVALAFAAIIGLIVALVAKKIVGMKIPVLEICTLEIAGAGGLSVLAFSTALAGSYHFDVITSTVVATGFIGVFFILNTMAIQHPFNACLGPNEDQVRTLKCAVSCGFLAMTIAGILAIVSGSSVWVLITLVGFIGWLIGFRSFVKASCEAAASVKWAGLWPEVEEQ